MLKKEISNYYTDENVVRIIAVQVTILATLSLIYQCIFPLYLLIGDFALRAFTYFPSPLAALAKIFSHALKLKPKPIFAAPKKFAASVGFIFSLFTLVLFLLNLDIAAFSVGNILIICAVLESVFKVCIGCYVYDWLVAPIINNRNKENINN